MIVALATGSGRCGTQTFGAQMQRIKKVLGVHEGVHMVYMRGRSHTSPHLSCGDPSARQWNLDALNDRRAWAYRRHQLHGIRAYGEAAHYFGLNMPLVEKVFPEARIVHLVREPVSMVWSMLQHARADIYAEGKHNRTKGRWKWWGDCFPLFQSAVDRASGFATYWETVNRAVEQTSLPRLLVRTEELRKAETWEGILDFIGLDACVDAPSLVFNAIHPRKKIRGEIPPAIVKTVRRLCTWEPK